MARTTHGKVAFRLGDGVQSLGGVAAAGLGAWEFITAATATSASEWSSGSLQNAVPNYIAVKVIFTGVRTATRSSIGIRTSSDGTNYSATTSAYRQAGYGISATDTGAQSGNFLTETSVILTSDNTATAFLATELGDVLSGEFILSNISATATTIFPQIQGYSMWQGVADNFARRIYARRSEAIPQMGVLMVNRGGGIFIDGNMYVYGLRSGA